MKRLTVAEIRRNNVLKLAERSDAYASDPLGAINRAYKAMNSFYRLAGYSNRLFEIQNDYKLYQRYEKRLEKMEKREDAWIDRVNKYLEEFHARAVYNGVYPSVCDEKKPDDNGTVTDLFLTSWY